MWSSNKTDHCTGYQHDSGYWIQALTTTRTSRTKPGSYKASPGFPQTWETYLLPQASQCISTTTSQDAFMLLTYWFAGCLVWGSTEEQLMVLVWLETFLSHHFGIIYTTTYKIPSSKPCDTMFLMHFLSLSHLGFYY